jgi:hypothetical protein
MVGVALLALICCTNAGAAASLNRDCTEAIPRALTHQLNAEFGAFQLPRLSDYDPHDLRYFRKGTRRLCPSVVFGDFDGDGAQDVALIIAQSENSSPKLVIALHGKRRWHLYTPGISCGYAPRCYVDSLRPGIYTRTRSYEGNLSDPTDKETLRTRHTSVLAGQFESTGVLYAFSKGKWIRVVLSN